MDICCCPLLPLPPSAPSGTYGEHPEHTGQRGPERLPPLVARTAKGQPQAQTLVCRRSEPRRGGTHTEGRRGRQAMITAAPRRQAARRPRLVPSLQTVSVRAELQQRGHKP